MNKQMANSENKQIQKVGKNNNSKWQAQHTKIQNKSHISHFATLEPLF